MRTAGTHPWRHLIGSDVAAIAVDTGSGGASAAPSVGGPAVIASLEAWLEPDLETAYADGATLTTLHDQSGNGNHFTNTGTPTWVDAVLNGCAVVDFPATTATLTAGGNFMSGKTAGELWVVMRVDADPPASANAAPFRAQGVGTDNHVPWVDGTVYEAFGSTARKTTGNPTDSLASWTLYNVRSAAGAWSVHINNALHYSTATNTVGFTNTPLMGTTSGRNWPGQVALVLVFSAVLSSSDRTIVTDYIADRFAL